MGNTLTAFLSLTVSHDFASIAFSHLLSLSPQPPPPASSLDPTILGAFIGLSGIVLAALIGGAFAFYQMQYQIKRNAQLEQQRQVDQFQHDKEIERLRQALEKELKRDEREQHQQEDAVEAANLAMLRARTRDERVLAYRQALRVDPRIARLQILDMTQPLGVTDVFVRLRLHEESRLSYRLDFDLSEAEGRNDPNELLKRGQKRLEQRISTSISPEEAISRYKRSIAPQLLDLLANEQVDASVRKSITSILPVLIENEEQVCTLAALLTSSDIADNIQRALWTLSRQFGLRIW